MISLVHCSLYYFSAAWGRRSFHKSFKISAIFYETLIWALSTESDNTLCSRENDMHIQPMNTRKEKKTIQNSVKNHCKTFFFQLQIYVEWLRVEEDQNSLVRVLPATHQNYIICVNGKYWHVNSWWTISFVTLKVLLFAFSIVSKVYLSCVWCHSFSGSILYLVHSIDITVSSFQLPRPIKKLQPDLWLGMITVII